MCVSGSAYVMLRVDTWYFHSRRKVSTAQMLSCVAHALRCTVKGVWAAKGVCRKTFFAKEGVLFLKGKGKGQGGKKSKLCDVR